MAKLQPIRVTEYEDTLREHGYDAIVHEKDYGYAIHCGMVSIEMNIDNNDKPSDPSIIESMVELLGIMSND